MIDLPAVRPRTSTIQQWWVLTVRVIVPTLRTGELLTQVASSVLFTVGFYIPLKELIGAFAHGTSSYAQYLMPLAVLQAVYFAAMWAAIRSAIDSGQRINRRFHSMPIAPLTPLAARMSASVYRCSIALVIALLCCHVIGFRFYRGAAYTVGFCLLVLLIGVMLAFIGDLIGAASENPEATTHLLMLPPLILGLLSVGVQPAVLFPEWIQPFVRDQPLSQFVYALRALAGDSTAAAGAVTWSVIGPALAWVVGMTMIALPLHAFVSSRRR